HFDADVLKQYISFKSGEWYNADEVENSVDKMTEAMGDMQYAFVSIRPDIRRDRDAKTVNVVFQIDETPRVYVERIDIRGNVRTLDKVIRREMELVEGDPFSRTKVSKSEKNIRNLGFFEDVKVTPEQGSAPDKSVIGIDVAEQSTGELSIGAGFSTQDGPLADLRIKERNLLGKGQELMFATTVAGKKTEFDLSFTEPYFLDRDFSAGIDLYHITRDLQDESSYDQKRTGGALRFGYPLSEKWRQSVSYNLESNTIENVNRVASRFIRDQEGDRITSSVAQRTTYDDRDSVIFPTSGLYSWLDTEVAGLGGDAHFISGKLGASYFYPIADNWIFNVLGEGGIITGLGEDVRINDRYFLGGSTLRGFERAGAGPRDIATDDSLGGNQFYRGTAELTFPLGLPEEMGIKGHGFTDIGSLWGLDDNAGVNVVDESSLRAAAGVGVSWKSPLGPVRVDLSKPYLSESYDKDEVFRFNFGTRF
ncbi:MAG TPA: outer membrane protein assembly factor BamA, partial [Alphaproteobacteria bacterium]